MPVRLGASECVDVDFRPGDVRANSAIVPLSDNGALCEFSSSNTDVVLDVTATIADSEDFGALNPARLIDSPRGGTSTPPKSARTEAVRCRSKPDHRSIWLKRCFFLRPRTNLKRWQAIAGNTYAVIVSSIID